MKPLLVVMLLLSPMALSAGERKWYDRFELGGYVDVYYALNTTFPDSRESFVPGIGTSAKRANQFALNLAAVELRAVDPVIVCLALQYGAAADTLFQAGGGTPAPDGWKYLQQAYLGYRIPVGRGLIIEAGIFPSHVGFELLPTQGNWNYTHGWLADTRPYFQAGARIRYAFTDALSAELSYLNGWQTVGENNNWKTVGAQVAWRRPRYALVFNTLIGPEEPGTHDLWRFFFEGIAEVGITDWLRLAAVGDYGFEMLPGGGFVHFGGGAFYGRARLVSWLWLALRGEIYRDGLGTRLPHVLTGFDQLVGSLTLTAEARLVGHVSLKIEGRYDRSDGHPFDTRNEAPLTRTPVKSDEEGMVLLGAVATF